MSVSLLVKIQQLTWIILYEFHRIDQEMLTIHSEQLTPNTLNNLILPFKLSWDDISKAAQYNHNSLCYIYSPTISSSSTTTQPHSRSTLSYDYITPSSITSSSTTTMSKKQYKQKLQHISQRNTTFHFPTTNHKDFLFLTRLYSLLYIILLHLQSNSYISLRDLYYSNPALFLNQTISNHMLSIVQSILRASREDLHVIMADRGLCFGPLTITINHIQHQPQCPFCPILTTNINNNDDNNNISNTTHLNNKRKRHLDHKCSCPTNFIALLNFIQRPQSLYSFSHSALLRDNINNHPDNDNQLIFSNIDSNSQFNMSQTDEINYSITINPPSTSSTTTFLPQQQQQHQQQTSSILIVEKEAIFSKLICKDSATIFVTSKGYPTITARKFLYNLTSNKNYPPSHHNLIPQQYILVDGDAHGIDICIKYLIGSPAQSLDCPFSLPHIQYIGIRPSIMSLLVKLQKMHQQQLMLTNSLNHSYPPRHSLTLSDCLAILITNTTTPKVDPNQIKLTQQQIYDQHFTLYLYENYLLNNPSFAPTSLLHNNSSDIIRSNNTQSNSNHLQSILFQPLTPSDITLITSILTSPFFTSPIPDSSNEQIIFKTRTILQIELQHMLTNRIKCEIEALTTIHIDCLQGYIDYCMTNTLIDNE